MPRNKGYDDWKDYKGSEDDYVRLEMKYTEFSKELKKLNEKQILFYIATISTTQHSPNQKELETYVNLIKSIKKKV